MPNLDAFLKYSETAFGAYGSGLQLGTGNERAYSDADMTPAQAVRFDASWRVLGQQDLTDGFSATLFQEVDVAGIPVGQKVLAIRGTESSHWGIDFLGDVVNVALLGTATGFAQYNSLERFYQSLITQGKLTALENIVVTGHSLGGFLAQAFSAKHLSVSAAYTYNSPGFSVAAGLVSNVGTQLLKFFGLSGSIPNEKIFNVRAFDGLSGAAGLGQTIGSVELISIEAGSPIHNHSIVTLTDTLSLYGLYARLDDQLSLRDMESVFRASSNQTRMSLETGLDDLRRVILGSQLTSGSPTGVENREAFHANLQSLSRSDELAANEGRVRVVSLSNKSASSIAALTLEDVAYRYSISQLLAFSITGSADLYDRFNTSHELDLYDSQTGTGLTEEYLADRAAMLAWKIRDFTADGQATLRQDKLETYRYVDKTLKNAFGNDLSITVSGRQLSSISNPALITFGSDLAETLTGSNLAIGDHLYGAGGNDVLDGQGGDDYLEAGSGDDQLLGGDGDDELNGGTGFDNYVYEEGDGFDTISDPGGDGRIRYMGRDLVGGTKTGEGMYEDEAGITFVLLNAGADAPFLLINGDIFVDDFVDGALGIHLTGESQPPETPESSASNVYRNRSMFPVGFNGADLSATVNNAYGSMGEDQFLVLDSTPSIIGRSGNDVAILGGSLDVDIDMGADDDFIDASESSGITTFARLAGGGGNDSILGGAGDESIWGDNYIADYRIGGSIALVLIDDFRYNVGPFATPLSAYLPTAYGAFVTPLRYLTDIHGVQSVDPNDLVLDGTVFSGSLEGAIQNVVGVRSGFDDYLDAGAGDDFVAGGSGSDFVFGGSGNDRLYGDYGGGPVDSPSYIRLQRLFGPLASLFGLPGDDYIDGGEGDDYIDDSDGGNDVLLGGPGDDEILSVDGHLTFDRPIGANNVIDGGDGDDLIKVNSAADGERSSRAFVLGGNGNDTLEVSAGDAFLDGGAGDDTYLCAFVGSYNLHDAAGNDTLHTVVFDFSAFDATMEAFISNPYEENDFQVDMTVARSGNDLVVLAQDVGAGELNGLHKVRIEGWYIAADYRIENVISTTASGDFVFSAEEFETWGGLHVGGYGDDEFVQFSEYADRVFGGGGNDLIATGDGADRIFGGTGNDELHGGEGDDTYYYALGDGDDVIEDPSGVDEIRFGPAISAADVVLSLKDAAIVLTVADGHIEVSGASRLAPGIERLRFIDGNVVALSTLIPALPDPVLVPDDPPVLPPPDPPPPTALPTADSTPSTPPPTTGPGGGTTNAGESDSPDGGGSPTPAPDPVAETAPDPVTPPVTDPVAVVDPVITPSPAPDIVLIASGSNDPVVVPNNAVVVPPAVIENPVVPVVPVELPLPSEKGPIASHAEDQTEILAEAVEIPVVTAVEIPVVTAVAPVELTPVTTLDADSVPDAVGAAKSTVIASTDSTNSDAFSVQSSTFGPLNLASREDTARLFFGDPTDEETVSARPGSSQPLDMQTMLDAVQAFDDGASGAVAGNPARLPEEPVLSTAQGQPSSPGQNLTSWALTNALIQFHLDSLDSTGAGDAPADSPNATNLFAAFGGTFAQQGLGLSGLGGRVQGLSTFSGLQEGFTRL